MQSSFRSVHEQRQFKKRQLRINASTSPGSWFATQCRFDSQLSQRLLDRSSDFDYFLFAVHFRIIFDCSVRPRHCFPLSLLCLIFSSSSHLPSSFILFSIRQAFFCLALSMPWPGPLNRTESVAVAHHPYPAFSGSTDFNESPALTWTSFVEFWLQGSYEHIIREPLPKNWRDIWNQVQKRIKREIRRNRTQYRLKFK